MKEQLPNFFDNFEPNRVEIGETLDRREMIRRISHYLRIPQAFGNRIITAFDEVIADAMLHGEGVMLKNAGTLLLTKYNTNTIKVFGEEQERKHMYKYRWRVSKEAQRYLLKITELDKLGQLEGFLANPPAYA